MFIKKGGILIVDEAHGAHFKFDNYFPTSAVELGADIVIESIHKTLPAMTQTSILHICSENIDEKKVERFLSIYESSSPSYVLMASVEKCMDIIDNGGKKLFNEYVNRLEKYIVNAVSLNAFQFLSQSRLLILIEAKLILYQGARAIQERTCITSY